MPLTAEQLREAGLAAAGTLPAADALCRLHRGATPPPPFAGVLVAVFPYYAGTAEGNLSLYARGRDYHLVARERLETAAVALGLQGRVLVDSSPFDEVGLAVDAGLGNIGQNGLLVSAEFGSFCFVGTLLTEQALPHLSAGLTPGCTGCGACVAACPTDALEPGHGPDEARCLSAITQLRRVEGEQALLLEQASLVWGCDTCQLCCPANRGLAVTSDPAFSQELLHSLEPQELDGLSDSAFRRRYGERAFSWRGIAPLRRNLHLRGKNDA